MRRRKAEERAEWLKNAWALIDDPETKECAYCGGYHFRECPRVRRIVFYPPDSEGRKNVQEVEYWPHGQWPEEDVIFVEKLPVEEDG